ncbi:hypothetical protein QUC31_015371 [Theobroma cacao]
MLPRDSSSYPHFRIWKEWDSLGDHLLSLDDSHSLAWTSRLKIAADIANAVAYLHFAFPRPIIHRDISKSHVQDQVVDTMGCVAPEYCKVTGCFNEKNDVFSFGVLLLVLLTGTMRFYGFYRYDVKQEIEDDRITDIADSRILDEGTWTGKEEGFQAFAVLAHRCIRNSKRR